MTTINSYSVGISLNASGLVDGSKLARNELASLNRTFSSLATPAEKMERHLNLIEKAARSQAIAEDTAAEATRRLTAKYTDMAAAVARDNALIAEGERLTRRLMTAEEKHAQELRRINELYKQGAIGATTLGRARAELAQKTMLANAPKYTGGPTDTGGTTLIAARFGPAVLGAAAVLKAMTLANESIDKFASNEKAIASFDVLAGSAQKAASIIAGTRSLAARGLSLDALNQSARTMLSFNVAAKDVIPSLERIGNITGGDTERLKMLSLAFSQSSAAGRLMGQDLLQMINAGFNPLQEISRKTGKSLVDLKKDMEAGLISFSMVNDAFRTATESGGLYNGMLSKMGETTAGAMDRANAKVEMLKISLGEALSPAVRELANVFTTLSGSIANSTKDLASLVQGTTAAVKSLESLTGAFSGIGKALRFIKDYSPSGLINRVMGNASDQVTMTLGKIEEQEKAAMRYRERSPDFMRFFSPVMYAEAERLKTLDAQLLESNRKLTAEAEKSADLASEEAKRRKEIAGPTQEASTQADKISQAYDRTVNSLTTQIAKLKEGQVAAAGIKAELAGMNDQQRQHITALTKEVQILEQLAKSKTMLNSQESRQRQQLDREADRFRDRFATPIERLARQMADINRLQQVGALSAAEAARARRTAASDSTKDIKFDRPEALTVGSQGAYELVTGQMSKQTNETVKALGEAKVVAEAQLELARQIKAGIDRLADTSPRKHR